MATTDPYASMASKAPPAAPAAPAADPYASMATAAKAPAAPTATTTPPAAPSGQIHEGMVDHYLNNAPWWDPVAGMVNLTAGIGAGAEQTAAGLTGIGRKMFGGKEPTWIEREAAKPTHGTAQAVGKGAEAVGEFFTGEELLSMLGRTGAVMNGADKLKQASQIATMTQKIPMLGKLLRIGMETVKQGGLGAAQEYAKTGGDTEAATTAGELTGGLTAGLGVAGIPVGAGLRALESLSPVQKILEGVPITALKSQINKAGKFIEGGDISELAPQIAEDQQRDAQHVLRNVAARAAGRVLGAINDTRQLFRPMEDPARLLPAPEGAKPFMFDLGEVSQPVEETKTGTLLQRAEKTSATERTAAQTGGVSPQGQQLGSTAATVPERMLQGQPAFTEAAATGEGLEAQTAAQSKIDQKTIADLEDKQISLAVKKKKLSPDEMNQLNEARAREAQLAEGRAGQGPLETKTTGGTMKVSTPDAAEAVAHLHNLNELRQSPDFSKLSKSSQNAIEATYQRLRDQVEMYHASPYRNPRFDPIDIGNVTRQIHTFGQAADQIKDQVRPVFQRLNEISDNQLGQLTDRVDAAKNAVRSARTDAEFTAANDQLKKAHANVDDFLNSHSGDVSRGDHAAAKQAWREASKLDQLHAVYEHMMNGVTQEESAEGYSRVMTGNARRLQNWLDNSDNEKMLDSMIGEDGRKNLKEITLLMSKVTPSRHVAGAAKNLNALLGKQRWHWAGGFAGAAAGRALGIPEYIGAGTGVAAAEGMRQVLRQAATNPRVGTMLRYAIKAGVPASIYTPLIARTIAEPFLQSEQGQTEEGNQDESQ